MNLQQKFSLLSLVMALLLIFSSCQKDTEQITAEDEATIAKAKESLASQQLILSSFNIAKRGVEESEGFAGEVVKERVDTCGSVAVVPPDLLVFPKTVTVDFGNGCDDADGKFKAGKVVLTVGAIWEPNAQVVVAYDNYSEDGVSVEGEFVFTNLSTASAAILRIDAQNIHLTDPNGYTLSFSGNQTYTQIEGHPSWWNWQDDVYQVTGDISSTLTNGETVDWDIQTPLKKANVCYYVSQGAGLLNINGLAVGVDFGDGTCDNKGTFTINGQTYPFTM